MRFYNVLIRFTNLIIVVPCLLVLLNDSKQMILDKELLLCFIMLIYVLIGYILRKIFLNGNYEKVILSNSKLYVLSRGILSILSLGYILFHLIILRNIDFDSRYILFFFSIWIITFSILSFKRKIFLSNRWILLDYSDNLINWSNVSRYSIQSSIIEIWHATGIIKLDFKKLDRCDIEKVINYMNVNLKEILNGTLEYKNNELREKENAA